jgi:hypothetical protein
MATVRHRLYVVLSQAQSKHPAKRGLEEGIVTALLSEPGIEVGVIPHLYDLDANHPGRLLLEGIRGDMVLLSWLYPRAAFWLLDRDGVKGHEGVSALKPTHEEEDEEQEPPKGIGSVNVPDRTIWCLDLRDADKPEPFVQEIRRLAQESKARAEAKANQPQMVELGLKVSKNGTNGVASVNGAASEPTVPRFSPEELLKTPGRRWHPVIDYSRCTNCMECIDFCLFGVYGVDSLDRITVEHQDNCKKGCPACSRVCPEHAIMFPEYKTPAIAGAPVGGIESLKIDLTKLFGGGDAMKIAADERDRELVADGRQAVGMTVGIPKRQAEKPSGPKDDLDKLMDDLDALEL